MNAQRQIIQTVDDGEANNVTAARSREQREGAVGAHYCDAASDQGAAQAEFCNDGAANQHTGKRRDQTKAFYDGGNLLECITLIQIKRIGHHTHAVVGQSISADKAKYQHT